MRQFSWLRNALTGVSLCVLAACSTGPALLAQRHALPADDPSGVIGFSAAPSNAGNFSPYDNQDFVVPESQIHG
jgi:hypothetical protein